MSKLSIRGKITLWFALILCAIVALTFVVIISVSGSVIQKTVKDGLIYTVSENIDEIEFFSDKNDTEHDNDADIFIEYKDGYLEVDDDFLDLVNGISTSLYLDSGVLLYGENPIIRYASEYGFSNGTIQRVSVNKITYYIYDRMLTQPGLEGLWLRGVVSEEQGSAQLSNIERISLYVMPILLILAVFGGYFIAGRTLRPIKKIESAAKQIGNGRDLKKRIELSPGTDELHQLADTFNEMFDRLDTSFERESRFTSDVSHELRTPITVILAQCEYSLDNAQTSEEYVDALRTVKRQGLKMSKLVEDMLCFTRLEGNADGLTKEKLDFSQLVSAVSREMELLGEQGITLTSEVEENVFVWGNRELLSRLLINLIGNAYRYGRENGFIKVTLTEEGDNAVLSVRDNGIGIAPNEKDKIFDRFYQVDASRTGKGTGLGLAMVREIAKHHGGEILLESEPDKGSVFTLVLKKYGL